MLNNKTTQNISALIGDIGEQMVLFKIYALFFNDPTIEVFKNYSESGYDICIQKHNSKERRRIEVKTRQHIITSTNDNNKNTCHFTLTEKEFNSSDFLIGYWLDYNDFFIVPMKDLKPSKSNNKTLYKHVVSRLKNTKNNNLIYSSNSLAYLNNWELLKF